MRHLKDFCLFLITPEEESAMSGVVRQSVFPSRVAHEAAGGCKFLLWTMVTMLGSMGISHLH